MDNLIEDIGIIDNSKKNLDTGEIRVSKNEKTEGKRKLYIESYGCQMNFADSEIVTSIMKDNDFTTTSEFKDADVILLNTCSIREKAEQTIRKRLTDFNKIKARNPNKIVGVLGCMAERLKTQLLEEEKIVDLVAGPDAYRDLPSLINQVDDGEKAVNTFLSREETYADISPVRLNSNGVTAFISITRGCNNMCSFCVVPFTRGRERSRDPHSIVAEAKDLFIKGYREVTLLGQNVDSYSWEDESNISSSVNFAKLLILVANINPELRVRFSTSHPKDITNEVLYAIKEHKNICNAIHLPAQSGNSRILELMNRTYDREWYIERIDSIRKILGEECGLSSDMITGFCSETETEHKDTLSLMEYVQYDYLYMFYYSERPGTLAAKKLEDDVSLTIKKRRLSELISKQQELSLKRNQLNIGKIHKVLVEGHSKKSVKDMQGRNSANKVVVFANNNNFKKGQYVDVLVNACTPATLIGEAINKSI